MMIAPPANPHHELRANLNSLSLIITDQCAPLSAPNIERTNSMIFAAVSLSYGF